MRNPFRIQPVLFSIPVEEVELPTGDRHPSYAIARALKWFYPRSRGLAELVLQDVIRGKKRHRGAPGMTGWQILVLVVMRMNRELSFDEVAMEFNEFRFLRRILEIDDIDERRFTAKALHDNFHRIHPETIEQILVWFAELMKQEGIEDGQQVRGDSFVCGRPIHYPTGAIPKS